MWPAVVLDFRWCCVILDAALDVSVPFPFQPKHNKNNKITCKSSEDSDQPGHPLCAQWLAKDQRFLHADSELWSDWADVILFVLSCCGSFDIFGRMWISIESVSDHCIFIYASILFLHYHNLVDVRFKIKYCQKSEYLEAYLCYQYHLHPWNFQASTLDLTY